MKTSQFTVLACLQEIPSIWLVVWSSALCLAYFGTGRLERTRRRKLVEMIITLMARQMCRLPLLARSTLVSGINIRKVIHEKGYVLPAVFFHFESIAQPLLHLLPPSITREILESCSVAVKNYISL